MLLPARMVNEFVYCPRLFYYEFVEGLFAHNADTIAGKSQHKRQDKGEGALPTGKKKSSGSTVEETEAVEEIIHARSVNLGSERLGVVAKLDLAEVTVDGEQAGIRVCPVEYKKGKPRETDDGINLWDADKVQLGLQILLLRDNGYLCDEGVLYYRETKQRVTFVMDAQAEDWIVTQVNNARMCAVGPRPAPLQDSPKCPRCSLVALCLPDETSLLAPLPTPTQPNQLLLNIQADATSSSHCTNPFDLPEIHFPKLKKGEDVRRLIAPNPESRALYLNTPGHYISKKDLTLVVKEKTVAVAEFRLHDLHHLALFGPIQMSTQVIQTLCEHDIPITYFSMGGWFYGMTRGHGLTNVLTRIEQFAAAADKERAMQIARSMIHGKIRNQRTLLMRNHVAPPQGVLKMLRYLGNSALHASSLTSLLGTEGSAAALYFENFAGMLKTCDNDDLDSTSGHGLQFNFQERNRRPPRDPVNALLSLVYSLLVKDCTLAAYAVGFDPYVGFLHQPRHGKPALALDLMEEFRPLVADSVVLSVINKGIVRLEDFIQAGHSTSINTQARKRVFMAYEQRLSEGVTHPIFGYRVCYRRAIELQARLLAKFLTGDIEQYVPFMTR